MPPEPVEGFFSLSRSLLTPPRSFVFIQLHTLSFLDHSYPVSFPQLAHSSAKNGGYTPTWSYHTSSSSISFVSPSCERQPRISLVSPTYAKTGGCTPTQKCRRADIFDFSPDISHFLNFAFQYTLTRRARNGKGWPRRSIRGAKDAHKSQRYMEAGRATSHLSSTCPGRSATGPDSPSSAILWSGLQLGPSRLGRAANSIERFSYREYFCWK